MPRRFRQHLDDSSRMAHAVRALGLECHLWESLRECFHGVKQIDREVVTA